MATNDTTTTGHTTKSNPASSNVSNGRYSREKTATVLPVSGPTGERPARLRELIAKWRGLIHHYHVYGICADELETVLAAGGEPSPTLTHAFVGTYAVDPRQPADCQVCGRHVSEHVLVSEGWEP